MKTKRKLTVLGVCLTMAVSAALCACGGRGNGNNALSARDAYGLGAVSTAKLLGENVSAKAMRTFSKAIPLAEGTDANALQAEIEKFNEYFTALDSFLGEDLVTTVSETNTDETYPFETKLTITGKDLLGNTEEYIMYFTETILGTTQDEDEIETRYSLTGVMVIEGTDYYLEGRRTDETEYDETENELEIRAYADKTDKLNYIEMKQEQSEEANESETEYVYSVYAQGRLVEETAVEFETERKHGKDETEYELEFRKGDTKGKYKVMREIKNGTTRIKAEYKIDGKKGKFTIIRQNDDKYKYEFEDGSSFIL